ncbi:GYF domain protein [Dictyocaulus viviparus]|uniref:GYF domain protein n=1 Tax=Dictyocaulus viviparus TaxID=29172 RepID=A0A0D8XIH6_DICVI|nr:GYF domain protein [Dictyocaulus viviparus]
MNITLHRHFLSHDQFDDASQSSYWQPSANQSLPLIMSSTSPVATAPAVDSVQQNSFHPSWFVVWTRKIRSTFNGGTSGVAVRGTKSPPDNTLAAPVFVKNRYGREDLLALMGDASGHPAPEGLQNCPFYVEEALQPIVCYPLSDLEQRRETSFIYKVHTFTAKHQFVEGNGSLSHAERASVASGASHTGSTDGGTAGQKGSTGGWTSVKQWNRNHLSSAAPQKGIGATRTYLPSNRSGRGDGVNNSQDNIQMNSFGQKFANRGRGAPQARVGGGSHSNFNSRAQGLYDPRDPKGYDCGYNSNGASGSYTLCLYFLADRPRHRIRSTSEEAEVVGEGGWTSTLPVKQGWNNHSKDVNQPHMWASGQGDSTPSISETPEESVRKSESGRMPEWMEDGEDQDKTFSFIYVDYQWVFLRESGDDTTSATGSFDEQGRFQKKHHRSVDQTQDKAVKVDGDRREKQQSAKVENYGVVSGVERSTDSQQMPRESDSSSGQSHILNSEAESSRNYSNVLSHAEAVGYHPSVPSHQSIGSTSPVMSSTMRRSTTQFYYLDPTKQERGPFEKIQMESWYKRGYFMEGLEVRRHSETKYRTLGELMQLNGRMTPFDFKDDLSIQPPVTAVFSNPTQPFAALFASGAGNMWSELGSPASMIYSQTGYDPIAVERKVRMEDEQRRILEEQAKMREYQEHLIREMQKQREEQEKQLMEQKLALLKHQEEIERRERELKESAEETKARLEMERLALAEKARQLEEECNAKIQNLEEARKVEEERAEKEKRQIEEDLEKQRIADESLVRQQKIDMERQTKESAEEEARHFCAVNSEKLRTQQAEQQRKQRTAGENSRKNAAAQSANEKGKRSESVKTFEIEEAWQVAPKSSQTAVHNSIEGTAASPPLPLKSNSTKVAPWSAASAITPVKEKSLKEIQEEEERILRAEQAQQVRLRKEQESVNLQSSGTWSNASQRLQWNQPPQQTAAVKTNVKPAWGAVNAEQQKTSCASIWDGPSLQAANKALSSPPKKGAVSSEKSSAKSNPVKASTDSLANEKLAFYVLTKAAKRALGMCEDNSVFLNWVVQRLKQLNSSVEADVEDYVVGYLGDSKAVKEFVREFLQRRSDFRNRGQHAVKDDLSSARGAPVSGNGAGCFSVVQSKKKKNKCARLIVDGSCLGFRATSDPNRVNQGEIETVALTPGQKK